MQYENTMDKFLGEKKVADVTPQLVKKVYPVKISDRVAAECADIMNKALSDLNSVEKEQLRDSLINVIDVLKGIDGKRRPTFPQYVSAVKFVNYKMMGYTNTRAYALTFPDKMQRMLEEKLPEKTMESYAHIYAKTDTVVAVHAKMMVPTHILFQDYFSLAVKTQVEIMTNEAVSPKVRSDAANSLMNHLKQPDVKRAEIEINTKDSGVIGQLADALANLSAGQRSMMLEGRSSIKDITEAVIISEQPKEEDNE